MTTAPNAEAATSRSHVWLLIGSGTVAAAQIGKAAISVPMIREEMGLGLGLAGFIVATFATLGACAGIGAGALVQRLGLRRCLIGGMSAIALGNLIGAELRANLICSVRALPQRHGSPRRCGPTARSGERAP